MPPFAGRRSHTPLRSREWLVAARWACARPLLASARAGLTSCGVSRGGGSRSDVAVRDWGNRNSFLSLRLPDGFGVMEDGRARIVFGSPGTRPLSDPPLLDGAGERDQNGGKGRASAMFSSPDY